MQLHFKSYGRGEPLLILHGLFGSLDNWQSVSVKLSTRFQVFAVDQRNHGSSPHSPEMDYPRMAADLDEFMQSHGLAHAHVMGHSMGGKTAMQFALLFPERVDKLVVVDMAPRAYLPRHEKILRALLSLDLPAFETRHQIEEALAPAIPDLGTRQFLLKNLTRSPGERFRWKLGLGEISRNYGRLSEPVTGAPPFERPTLFIRGEISDFLTEADLPLIRQLFPTAELRSIPAAGHLVHVENTEKFLETLTAFLTER